MMLHHGTLRVTAAGMFLVIQAVAPICQVNAAAETVEQAKANEKAFAQQMAMTREASQANDQPTVQRLQSIKVEGIHWQNTDVQAALVDLRLKSKTVDPTHVGFDYVLRLPTKGKQTDCMGRVIKNNVCIILPGKTSLFNILNYISEQTNLSFEVQKGTIILKPWEPGAYQWSNLVQ